MKLKITLICWILFGLTVLGSVWAQQDAWERMDNSVYDHPRRPAVVFDHDEHNELAGVDDCAICHHVWEDGKLVADESSEDTACYECHDMKKGPKNAMALTNAYHTQCRTCHSKEGKGPLLCGQCHKK